MPTTWTGPDTMLPPGAQNAIAVAISDDGLTVAGQAYMPDGTPRGFVWVHGSAAVYIPPLAGCPQVFVNDITADGSMVYGYCTSADAITVLAFRWTAAGGTVDFSGGALPLASCCSADGAVVFGTRRDPDTGLWQAAKWTAAGGVVGIGGIYRTGEPNRIAPQVASADGATVWGQLELDPLPDAIFLGVTHLGSWNAGTGVVDHGSPPGDDYILGQRVTSVSADGSHIAVSSYENDVRGWLWTAPGTWTALTDPGIVSDAYGISADGSTIAGDFTVGDTEFAGAWTAAGGWVALPGAYIGAGTGGISPNGEAIFGYAFDDAAVPYAAVWRRSGGSPPPEPWPPAFSAIFYPQPGKAR